MPRKYVRKSDRSRYDNEKLSDAVKAVKNGTISAYAASKLYNIPRTTIVNRVYDRKGLKSKTLGRCTALPTDVEETLAENLHIMEKSGFGLTRKEVIELVGQYVVENNIKTPFKDGIPGEDWFLAFKNRHGLSVKKPQAVEHARKIACRPAVIYNYFDLLEKTIEELGLRDKPSNIWNLDETSFSKDPSKSNVVGRRGFTSTRTIASPGKTNTTVLLSCNAAGEKCPPLIIYTGKNIWNEWVPEDGFPGTVYAATEKGWMEAIVFENFFEKVFLPTVENKRPILLLYDGHSTHVGINIIQKARENNITILKIPPHTSHLLQPLDLAVNKSFKDKWDVELVKWQRLNVGKVLPKKEFSRLIGKVWAQTDSQICKAGFRKAGIYPLNKNVIPEEKFDPVQLIEWKNAKQLEKSQNQLVKNMYPKKLSEIALNVVNTINIKQQEVPQRSSIQGSVSRMDVLHSEKETAPSLNIESVQQRPKVQILDNQRVFTNVTFEELLLKMIKPGKPPSSTKKTKIATGAEVITHDHVYERYQKIEAEKKEKLKKQEENKANKEKKKQTKKGTISNNTGAEKKNGKERCENGGNYKQTDIHASEVDISLPGPSGLNKKRKIENESRKGKTISSTKKKVPQKKLRRLLSSSSTSVSDCMSVHSDSDIVDANDEEYYITKDLYINELLYNGGEQEDNNFSVDKESNAAKKINKKSDRQSKKAKNVTEKLDETNVVAEELNVECDRLRKVEKEACHAFTDKEDTEVNKVMQKVSGKLDEINDVVEKVCDISDKRNQATEEVGERSDERNNNTMAKEGNEKWDVGKNIEEKEHYEINDNVLVRYYNRKKWVYYVGYIERILSESDTSYDINFYKTCKRPLKFKLTKRADRDTVFECAIVKKVFLSQNPSNFKEFLLDEEDHFYFA